MDELQILRTRVGEMAAEIERLQSVIDETNAQEPVIRVRDGRVVDFNPNYDGDVSNGEFFARPIPAQQSPAVAQGELIKGEAYQAGLWSMRNAEAMIEDGNVINGQSPAVAVPDEWRESLSELVSAMNEYELSVDERAPHKHKKMMEKANRLLSSSHIDSTETETNYCALKAITDSQVNAVARAFWRRIYPYRNDYGIELPKPLPVEFMAHMATALTWVDKKQTPRITEQDAREIIKETFLANGFTIKDGLTDLKPYVYDAALALLDKLNKVTHETN